MSLEIHSIAIGQLENNCYLIVDPLSREAAVVDPPGESEALVKVINTNRLIIKYILLTHAHFDHISGVDWLSSYLQPGLPEIGLHPDDLPLWREGGGSAYFGLTISTGPEPDLSLFHGQNLNIGPFGLQVRHTPGHTPGHVIFYLPDSGAACVGDVIFRLGVGRTDFPGGNASTLMQSIRTQILTLPPETRLLPGHGPETSVSLESRENPFI